MIPMLVDFFCITPLFYPQELCFVLLRMMPLLFLSVIVPTGNTAVARWADYSGQAAKMPPGYKNKTEEGRMTQRVMRIGR